MCLQLDSLIEAFGTTKQKRALSSRRLNEVGSDTLQKAVAHAASNIIDQKGLEGKNLRACQWCRNSLVNVFVCDVGSVTSNRRFIFYML